MQVKIADLMEESGIKFGTSGARGLSLDMTDRICYAYTKGFLSYLLSVNDIHPKIKVAVAGDLRPSTGRIMQAVRRAIEDMGLIAINCGRIPSPAVANYGLTCNIPAIMVTGSHIPADRNGIKFNKCSGEVLKSDEPGITAQVIELPDEMFTPSGEFAMNGEKEWELDEKAANLYQLRYTSFFPAGILEGIKLAFYQHSAVGRELIPDIYRKLGAEVTLLGHSEEFVPVDTEAIRDEDCLLAAQWAKDGNFNSIVSTDGDSDRPLISDENGVWLRGDVAGILCAKFLQADSVSTPVSCNSAVDKSGFFPEIIRTRIGSPFVIESMNKAVEAGKRCVVGYEANGGFLLNTPYHNYGHELPALPTRDAVILHIAILLLAKQEGKTISKLLTELPARYTASGIQREFPLEKSQKILAKFGAGDEEDNCSAFTGCFGTATGARAISVDLTDGARATFDNEQIVHLRPSGNAPEFRCYTEAASNARAIKLNEECMKVLSSLKS